MSSQRYSPEFKDEAVRQVTERGYTDAAKDHKPMAKHPAELEFAPNRCPN
jgi:transposase-like protein